MLNRREISSLIIRFEFLEKDSRELMEMFKHTDDLKLKYTKLNLICRDIIEMLNNWEFEFLD